MQEISSVEKIKATLMAELDKKNNQLAALMKKLTTQKEKCEGIKLQISIAEG